MPQERMIGVWYPEQLAAAYRAYGEITLRLASVDPALRREAIASALLRMTGEGCLDVDALVLGCIASLCPSAMGKARRALEGAAV